MHNENLQSRGLSFIYLSGINYRQINDFWEDYKEKIKYYDCLFFSDLIVYALPFLLNIDKHNLKIIIYITNRFDFSIINETIRKEYSLIFTSALKDNRVFFCSDNNYDQYYASLYNIPFFYSDNIRLTPYIHNEILLPTNENKDKIFINKRGTQVHDYEHFLQEQDIHFEIFGEGCKRYKNEEEITEYLGFLHLPYQTNIQSLWENLGFFIIYFIPSKTFMKELVTKDWYYFEEKIFMDGKKNAENLLNISIDLSEWYHPENECFFEYFDSWYHLKEKLDEYRNNESKQIYKKGIIKEKIQSSNIQNLEKWRHIIHL